jgi:hypothetical protein
MMVGMIMMMMMQITMMMEQMMIIGTVAVLITLEMVEEMMILEVVAVLITLEMIAETWILLVALPEGILTAAEALADGNRIETHGKHPDRTIPAQHLFLTSTLIVKLLGESSKPASPFITRLLLPMPQAMKSCRIALLGYPTPSTDSTPANLNA